MSAVLEPVIAATPAPLPLAPGDLTPARIVAALDRYVIGQDAAKRAIAVALRNRIRRQRVTGPMQEEITPRNLLLIGPTGVGKSELARRLATLAGAPFVKVDATKFTEVGYVGRDVDSMVRDLMEVAVTLARAEAEAQMQGKAEEAVTTRLLDLLQPYPNRRQRLSEEDRPEPVPAEESLFGAGEIPGGDSDEQLYPGTARARSALRADLIAGRLDRRQVDLFVEEADGSDIPWAPTEPGTQISLHELFQNMLPRRRKKRRMTVAAAREILMAEELARAINRDLVLARAKYLAEEQGIIVIDELDKIAMRGRSGGGPEVSREGVQRDLLPIIEGTTVTTKYGVMRTDHILFIAAGAFHVAKPSDLIPELQGRFPIRVELQSLTASDFARILTEPSNALTRQYTVLLATDGVELQFTTDGITAIAAAAVDLNRRLEDIGARRLHTLLERILEDCSFDAPAEEPITVTVDAAFVAGRLRGLIQDEDLSRYIL
ncbi:MAG: ATP-dependent protease ATPase subunit HslU [bacterium]